MIKKTLTLLCLPLLLVACSSKEAENEDIRKQLEQTGAPGTGKSAGPGGGDYPSTEGRRPPGTG